MYLIVTIPKNIVLEPKELTRNLKETIKKKLNKVSKGKESGQFGYIVDIFSIEEYGEGVVQDTTGDVLYEVKFKALVFKPFKS